MNHIKRFQSFGEAEDTIQSQVVELCDTYSNALKQLIPILKKGMDSSTEPNDKHTLKELYEEGSDHLHNLVQLSIELKTITTDNRGSILEVSSEILANTIKFLDEAPKTVEKTSIYKKLLDR
jgi:hypothetical protein